jgi:hypothetical protein
MVCRVLDSDKARRLVLLATAEPWRITYAEEELGNALYPYDEDIYIKVDDKYPLLYVFSSQLSPREAFQIVVREPPAYIERVVPVEAIVKGVIVCGSDEDAFREFASIIGSYVVRRVEERVVAIEVKARRYYVKCSDREALHTIGRLLAVSGFRILRKAARTLKVEDTAYGIVVAVMPTGWDRVRFWREKRLGEAVT